MTSDPPPPLAVLVGPTASGKTAVSLPLAETLGAEILCVDSRQIYRGMEIGSAAPTPEERARAPHHFVAEIDPAEVMSAGEFGRRVAARRAAVESRGKRALLVGGSGLYLRAALGGLDAELPRDAALRETLRRRAEAEGLSALHAELAALDPESASRVSPRDAPRVTRALEIVLLAGRPASALRRRGRTTSVDARIVVLDRGREDLEARMRRRVEEMITLGLAEEVQALAARGIPASSPALRSVGYAETLRFIAGDLSRAAWIEEIVVRTRRFAKRQRTWFRSLEGAMWLRVEPDEAPGDTARRVAACLVGWK